MAPLTVARPSYINLFFKRLPTNLTMSKFEECMLSVSFSLLRCPSEFLSIWQKLELSNERKNRSATHSLECHCHSSQSFIHSFIAYVIFILFIMHNIYVYVITCVWLHAFAYCYMHMYIAWAWCCMTSSFITQLILWDRLLKLNTEFAKMVLLANYLLWGPSSSIFLTVADWEATLAFPWIWEIWILILKLCGKYFIH